MTSKTAETDDDLHYDAWLRALGKRLAAHRKRLGITQAKAADTCGIDVKFYQDLEYGRRPCSTRTLFGVTTAMHLGVDEAVPTKAELEVALAEIQERRRRNALHASLGSDPAAGPGVAAGHPTPTSDRHAVIGASG